MQIETHPLTPERWRDLAALFETSSTTRTCWCTWFRQSTADYRANAGAANKREFKRVVEKSDAPPGILAYVDGKAAGWCAVAPREVYPRLARSRMLKPVDDQRVWS